MKFRIGLIALAFAAVSAHAAGWPKEPDRIFGLKLGDSIAAEDINECAGPPQPPKQITFCVMRPGSGDLSLGGFPIYELRYGSLGIEEGRATSLSIFGKHDDYAQIRSLLVDRYGPPTSRSVERVRTKAGVPYNAESLRWTGKRIILTLEEFTGDVETSAMTFRYIPALAKGLVEQRVRDKRDAAKF